ncbi:hypothetical protein CROQUDRAFT_672323 [Cronartium quercuum f. sp. fusiforme G11]|uniref:amidase n=1 Tax=Cronartium quercuum f. sp. fusiforme G11 TaxID=708437 RepID=A0A9P6NJ56_9BASI|nr:hypothetical protein CROQUDRAFT_672323 [Cronartium quercuum f. sp. fusiforme G11]
MSLFSALISVLPFSFGGPSRAFQKIATDKQQQRHNRLIGPLNAPDNFFNGLSVFEITLLSTPASRIVEYIGQRRPQWTASNILKAFIKAAIRAHVETNCLTEIMFESALEQAAALDDEFARTGVLKGRLHGIPISLKDQFDIEGLDSSVGFSRYTNQPASQTCVLAQRLMEEGAVIFAKTNVPQTLLAFECSNPVFGITQNPHKRGFTCGGSSGGEAALLASDGSCIGIGSDVGGSLRIPAHYSGCYSLKPCGGRIPQTGMRVTNPGYTEIVAVVGPMARCVDDLALAMEILTDNPDHLRRSLGLIPLRFRPELIQASTERPLRLGFFTDDKLIRASPACQRAVFETVERLRARGHECVEIDVDRLDVLQGVEIFVGLSSADGYHTIQSHIGPDPFEPAMFLTTLGPRLPAFLRYILATILRYGLREKVLARLIEASRKKQVAEVQQWRVKKQAYEKQVRSYLWEEENFDALLCPTQAMPAVPNGSTWNKSVLAESTFLWNVVDSTVGQVPVTKVESEKDRSVTAEDVKLGIFEKGVQDLYDVDRMAGLPVGIQVVGGAWEEEKVLGIMKIVEGCWEDSENLFKPGSFLRSKETGNNRGLEIEKSN